MLALVPGTGLVVGLAVGLDCAVCAKAPPADTIDVQAKIVIRRIRGAYIE
jgi:hypothetical protein